MATQKLYAGVKLREIRSRLGLTQKSFADKLSVSLPYLNQMENNHRPVSAAVVLALAQEFGLDVTELTVGESELSAWLVQQAPRYGMTPDAFAKALVEAGQVPMAMQDIRRAKALALVLESASVVDTEGAVVDLKALDQDLAPTAD